MGAWGSDNFANDAALDMVENVLEAASSGIEAFAASEDVAVEDIDAIMACVEIHLALHERCSASPPTAEQAAGLREKVLALYDDQIDGLEPEPEYKVKRRMTLVETLDRYARAAKADGA